LPTALDLALSLWLALLSVVPTPPRSMRPCLDRGAHSIPSAAAEAATAYDVPVGVLLVAAWLESHAGCDPASGGCWGAPIDARHRLTAGRASHAASALSLGFRGTARRRGCGTWEGAVSHFRCGLCRCPPPPGGGYTAAYAIGLAERVYLRAGVVLPEQLRSVPSARRLRTSRP